ncbi:MAG TPA: nitroreductase family protein [Saprospiraceae bacterium]|nr:nitroreductase family protein [Saprospiraceae bacterium]HMP25439.1 nitroreductase family protein [Saprospiraceae bacterium]
MAQLESHQTKDYTNMEHENFVLYRGVQYPEAEMLQRSRDFYEWLNQRRSVRVFSDRPVPREVIDNIIMAASTAPSGAHKQPWTFCVVSDPAIKTAIREAAEAEEYTNYHGRMSDEWLADLRPFGTDEHKPFLEIAPYLIVVFKKSYDVVNGERQKCYYVNESVGLACGLLLAAVHHAGLVALTHTPSPMNFLQKILNRPEHEKPFLLIPVGYPADGAQVPDLRRKQKADVVVYY